MLNSPTRILCEKQLVKFIKKTMHFDINKHNFLNKWISLSKTPTYIKKCTLRTNEIHVINLDKYYVIKKIVLGFFSWILLQIYWQSKTTPNCRPLNKTSATYTPQLIDSWHIQNSLWKLILIHEILPLCKTCEKKKSFSI